MPPLSENTQQRAVPHLEMGGDGAGSQDLESTVKIVRPNLGRERKCMQESKKLKCYAGPDNVLRRGVKIATEQLEMSRNFSRASAIAQRNVVDAVGMENAKPDINGGG